MNKFVAFVVVVVVGLGCCVRRGQREGERSESKPRNLNKKRSRSFVIDVNVVLWRVV